MIIKNYESNYKMDIESLQIKNKSYYFWNDTIYIYDFDINLVKIFKRESKMMLIFIILDTWLSQIMMIL